MIVLSLLFLGIVFLTKIYDQSSTVLQATNRAANPTVSQPNQMNNGSITVSDTNLNTNGIVSRRGKKMSKSEQMMAILKQFNHKNIDFYGKVVDQDGMPLKDVAVGASVIYNSGFSSGINFSETKTDVRGLFEFHRMKGRTLGIGMEKAGYEYGGDYGPFQYSDLGPKVEHFTPDASNPIVFKMVKLKGAEPMIYYRLQNYGMPTDGSPLRINLTNSKKQLSDGDIILTLNRNLEKSSDRLVDIYPWTVELYAPGGGFIESTNSLLYLAPEEGYVEKITFGQTGNEPIQYNRPKYHISELSAYKQYYLRISNGCYARIVIDIGIESPLETRVSYTLSWWMNPKPGDHNLEYDPQKRVNE